MEKTFLSKKWKKKFKKVKSNTLPQLVTEFCNDEEVSAEDKYRFFTAMIENTNSSDDALPSMYAIRASISTMENNYQKALEDINKALEMVVEEKIAIAISNFRADVYQKAIDYHKKEAARYERDAKISRPEITQTFTLDEIVEKGFGDKEESFKSRYI